MSAAADQGVVVPMPARDLKLSREDMLELENSSLKVNNFKLQAERLQSDLLKAAELMKEEQNKLRSKLGELSEKYGVDLTKTKLGPDGAVL